MYATTSANAISSLGTPYAIQNGPLGYGNCGRKIKAEYGSSAIPSVLSVPQRSKWSPSDPVEPPVQITNFVDGRGGQGVPTPQPDPAPYQLVNENFEPSKLVGESCGLYRCGPGMQVYKTYENFNQESEVDASDRQWLLLLAVAIVAGIFYALARASK